jgi:hypothetical protein
MTKFSVPTPYGFTATRKSDRPYQFVVVYSSQPRGYRPSDRPGTAGWSQSASGAAKMARQATKHFDGVMILPVGGGPGVRAL